MAEQLPKPISAVDTAIKISVGLHLADLAGCAIVDHPSHKRKPARKFITYFLGPFNGQTILYPDRIDSTLEEVCPIPTEEVIQFAPEPHHKQRILVASRIYRAEDPSHAIFISTVRFYPHLDIAEAVLINARAKNQLAGFTPIKEITDGLFKLRVQLLNDLANGKRAFEESWPKLIEARARLMQTS